jgi:hypothetical protein
VEKFFQANGSPKRSGVVMLDFHLPKLNQKNINHLSKTITISETEEGIMNLPTEKSPGPDRFTADSTRPLKKI